MPVTEYYWDELSDNVLMEADENEDPKAVYTNEPGQFGELVSQERGGVESFYHFDGQGSTRELTDASETVTDEYTYTAFGETISSFGTTETAFGYKGALGYRRTHDANYYVRLRVLATPMGRWTSVDPVSPLLFTGSGADFDSQYGYAYNSPVLYNDPSGAIVVKPRLPKADPRSGAIECYCGDFTVGFNFTLSFSWKRIEGGTKSYIKGYIIQKVRIWENIVDCPDAGECTAFRWKSEKKEEREYFDFIPSRAPDVTFWEAVPVTGNQATAIFKDVSSSGINGFFRCGYYRAYGEIKFFPQDTFPGDPPVAGVGNLNQGIHIDGSPSVPPVWGKGKVKRAGGAPLSTYGPVPWWDNDPLEGPAYRLSGTDWNCCCLDRNLCDWLVAPGWPTDEAP